MCNIDGGNSHGKFRRVIVCSAGLYFLRKTAGKRVSDPDPLPVVAWVNLFSQVASTVLRDSMLARVRWPSGK